MYEKITKNTKYESVPRRVSRVCMILRVDTKATTVGTLVDFFARQFVFSCCSKLASFSLCTVRAFARLQTDSKYSDTSYYSTYHFNA